MIAFASLTQGEESQTSQWKFNGFDKTLYDYLQDGYRVIAVTSEPTSDGDNDNSSDTYFLQKNTKVARCIETHSTNVKARESTSFFICHELVRPYKLSNQK